MYKSVVRSIRFTEDEYLFLKSSSAQLGFKYFSQFLRSACLALANSTIKNPTDNEEVLLAIDANIFQSIKRTISGIGTNVNQIAHATNSAHVILGVAHQQGFYDTRDIERVENLFNELKSTVDEVWICMKNFYSALSELENKSIIKIQLSDSEYKRQQER